METAKLESELLRDVFLNGNFSVKSGSKSRSLIVHSWWSLGGFVLNRANMCVISYTVNQPCDCDTSRFTIQAYIVTEHLCHP